jgi:hypothetical protein
LYELKSKFDNIKKKKSKFDNFIGTKGIFNPIFYNLSAFRNYTQKTKIFDINLLIQNNQNIVVKWIKNSL